MSEPTIKDYCLTPNGCRMTHGCSGQCLSDFQRDKFFRAAKEREMQEALKRATLTPPVSCLPMPVDAIDIERFARMLEALPVNSTVVDGVEYGSVSDSPALRGDQKDTNPKDSIGIRKAPLSVVPLPVLQEVGVAMLEGACKYGRHNYRAAGVRASVYFDAVVARHLFDWWEGEDIDPDSQLSHITKAIAGLVVLRDSMLRGNWVDDRPPRSRNRRAELNAHAAALIEQHADKRPRHYTQADGFNQDSDE